MLSRDASAELFVAASLVAALAALLAGAGWRRALLGSRWIDPPRAGRFHEQATSLAGGPAWLTGFLLGGLFAWIVAISRTREAVPDAAVAIEGALSPEWRLLALVVSAATLAYLLGDLDDRGRIGPLPKALLQAALVIAPWLVFVSATQGRDGFTATSLIALGIALALQLALGIFDNMDGTLGAVSTVGLLVLGADAPFRSAWIAAGATAGFLVWNRPRARLFLGNRGSSALATTVAILFACHANAHALPASLGGLAPFVWPLADLLFVTVRRLRNGRRPWHGGKDHTTHEIARLLGSDRSVWLAVAASASLGALLPRLLR